MSGHRRFLILLATLTLVGGVLVATPASAAIAPRIMVWWTGKDNIIGEGWTVGSTVTLTADDPATPASPDWTQPVVVAVGPDSGAGPSSFDVSAGIDLRVGYEITATDGVVDKSLTIEDVIVTSIDIDADTVSGMVRPFSGVSTEAFSYGSGRLGSAGPTADASGRWIADFSVPRSQPNGGQVVDIRPGHFVKAGVGDEDNDWSYWQADVGDVINVVQTMPDFNGDLCLDNVKALLELGPGEVVSSIPFDPSPTSNFIDLALVEAGERCDASPVAEATHVSLLRKDGKVKNVTAVAYRTSDGVPTFGVFTNNVRPTEPGTARVIVRQTTDTASLDLWVDGKTLGQNLAPGAFAKLNLTAGVHALWLSESGDYLPVVGPDIVKLAEGVAYQMHAWRDSQLGSAFAVIDLRVGTRPVTRELR